MLVLTVAKGPDRGAVFELRDRSDVRIVIGRNSPDLKLNDIMISRHHARLKYDGRRWIVRDLGSRNGTKLNGERLQKPTVLMDGDRIVTGYTEFVVTLTPDPKTPDAVAGDEPAGASDSHADAAGAASSFIPAEVASGVIEPDPVPPQKAQAPRSAPARSESESKPVVAEIAPASAAPATGPLIDEPALVASDAPASEPARVELPPVSISASTAPASDEIVPPPVAGASERAASEWKDAIESQLVVIDKQGWDETADEEDDGMSELVASDDDLPPLDDDERSQLYLDEDEHWADDVPLDDDELIQSLKEDGPEALLRDLEATPAPTPATTPTTVAEPPPAEPESGKGKTKKRKR